MVEVVSRLWHKTKDFEGFDHCVLVVCVAVIDGHPGMFDPINQGNSNRQLPESALQLHLVWIVPCAFDIFNWIKLDG